jgi:hypothetical protein
MSVKSADKASYTKGEQEADRDLRMGKRLFKMYGLFAPWQGEFESILKAQYGLTTKRVAGCRVTERQEAYVAGYNDTVEWRLSKDFGERFVACAAEKAETRYREGRMPPNTNQPMQVSADSDGRLRCPNCGKRFTLTDSQRWLGGRHTTCGQELLLT